MISAATPPTTALINAPLVGIAAPFTTTAVAELELEVIVRPVVCGVTDVNDVTDVTDVPLITVVLLVRVSVLVVTSLVVTETGV